MGRRPSPARISKQRIRSTESIARQSLRVGFLDARKSARDGDAYPGASKIRLDMHGALDDERAPLPSVLGHRQMVSVTMA